MQRIRVVGTTGAGKTQLARQLAKRLELPHLELDALQHLPGWQPAPLDQFRTQLSAFLFKAELSGGWIIGGNYNDRAPELFDAADTVVWLDYPRWIVMARVIRRSLGRALMRRKLWNDNLERLRFLCSFDSSENIVLWAWTQHEPGRHRYLAAMDESSDVDWARLQTPRQARAWLRSLQ